MPQISTYSSVRYNVGWNSLFFFFLTYSTCELLNSIFSRVITPCEGLHSEQATSIVWWSGLCSFTQGVDPFYKDNFLLQTKGLQYRQPLKQGLWIFFGILNIPHTHTFVLTDDPSGLLLFIKKCISLKNLLVCDFTLLCTPQSEFKRTKCYQNLEGETPLNYFRC